ncbi:Uncharacterised protein [Bordetella pertussis]|nr:Uncharacterised protein [Bordetella pertussis]CFT88593.1 Uncharacterised protein [Bordetella pertussis]
MARSSSATDLPSASRAVSAVSSGNFPANTPEPIITGRKREPSSLVQIATSSGASVCTPWSSRVRMTSSPASTP